MLKKPFENASKSDRLNIELAKKNQDAENNNSVPQLHRVLRVIVLDYQNAQVVVAAPSENIPMDTIAEFTLLENCAPRMAKCYL